MNLNIEPSSPSHISADRFGVARAVRLQNMEDPDDVDDLHSYLLRQPVIHSLAKVS